MLVDSKKHHIFGTSRAAFKFELMEYECYLTKYSNQVSIANLQKYWEKMMKSEQIWLFL